MFVRQFLTKLGRSVARRLRQEVPDLPAALVLFRCPPALSATAGDRLFDLFGSGGAPFPVDLGSPVNLGSGSLRSVASAVNGAVAPIVVLLSMT